MVCHPKCKHHATTVETVKEKVNRKVFYRLIIDSSFTGEDWMAEYI